MTLVLPKPLQELPLPFLIVCEGYGDAQFFDHLLKHHQITNYSIGCPSRDVCQEQEGENDLQRYLAALRVPYKKQTPPILRGLLVVVDADDKPADQFAQAVAALTFAGFPAPARPFVSQEDAQMKMRTAVFLMPGEGKTGTLENILLDAATGQSPQLVECLDRFSECTGVIPTATANKQAKMKMSVLVGGLCQRNPWATVALMWKDPGNPVPIGSPVFQPIVAFIRQFAS